MQCLWIEKVNIVKMSIFLKLIYRYNPITVKIPLCFFVETDKVSQ